MHRRFVIRGAFLACGVYADRYPALANCPNLLLINATLCCCCNASEALRVYPPPKTTTRKQQQPKQQQQQTSECVSHKALMTPCLMPGLLSRKHSHLCTKTLRISLCEDCFGLLGCSFSFFLVRKERECVLSLIHI